MSYFDDASLVMIPSGYKTSKVYSVKPTDGSGDLTFSRSNDTATRVNSAGLIEKVRTNLILQSNTFSNASWSNIGSSETSGQAGYDGTNNAWSLVEDSSTGLHTLVQVPSTFGSTTLSVYAKAGTRNWIFLRGVQSSSNVRAWFNLSTGTIGTVEANGTAKIESVGNGWYRCSLAVSNFQSGFEAYVGISSADNTPTYAGNGTGNILIQNFQYEVGDIATDYIATTSAAVSVGPVANVPRLDYLNSSCPRLLLEPQRTNLALYSEQFNNAAWQATRATITANAVTSPDGYTNADLYTDGTFTGSTSFVEQAVVVGGSGTTYSVFVKKGTAGFVQFGFYDTDFHGFVVNTTTWATTHTFGSASLFTATNYGNGWYRLSMYKAASSNTIYASVAVAANSTGANYNGTGALNAYFWGAQIEGANSNYATSYIPTLGSASTRGSDAASKTGISSLIGQTEGTFFLEIDVKNAPVDNSYVLLRNAAVSNYLGLRIQGGNLRFETVDNFVIQTTINYVANTPQTVKVAMAYKLNDFVMYVNGTQVGTDTSATVPTCDILDLNFNVPTNNAFGIGQALLFKTRLSNSELAALTA